MIGYCDPHLFDSTPTKLNLPNVDIMKVATYYKEQNEYGRLILPNESTTNTYDKIYCFSEVPCNVPDNIKRARNVIYGGSFFNGGNYEPFEDAMINYTAPKIGIYYEFLKQCSQNPKQINDFLDSSYYRVGTEALPYTPPIIHKGHKLYLYDKNIIENPNWEYIVNGLSNYRPSTIICIHPIVCTRLSQFFTIRKIRKISRDNCVVLNLAIPGNEVNYLFKQYLHLFQAEIVNSSNVCLQLGGNLGSNAQYYQNFIYVLNLLFCFWAKEIPIKIWYKETTGGYQSPIAELSRMVATWADFSTPRKRTLSLNDTFYKSMPDSRRDEMEKLTRNFPQARNLFNQNYEALAKKKYWGF